MKIDCFLPTFDRTPNRIEWCRKTLTFLMNVPELQITLFDAGSKQEQLDWFKKQGLKVVEQPLDGSIHRRFLLAELFARSDYYIFADNDHVPVTENWLPRALEALEAHKQFGYVLLRRTHCDFSHDHQFIDNDIRSIGHGGGFGFIRRNCRDAAKGPFRVPLLFNPNDPDDRQYTAAIKKSGLLVGQFEKIYALDQGHGESSAWWQCRPDIESIQDLDMDHLRDTGYAKAKE